MERVAETYAAIVAIEQNNRKKRLLRLQFLCCLPLLLGAVALLLVEKMSSTMPLQLLLLCSVIIRIIFTIFHRLNLRQTLSNFDEFLQNRSHMMRLVKNFLFILTVFACRQEIFAN
jgi:hypothetical protein